MRFEGLALERPPLPIRSICRQIRQFAEASSERPPGYGTVYDLVREVPGSLVTLAHRGSKAYGKSFDLVHRREAPRANAIWQADHAQLSILLPREDGQLARPWLTIVIDDYSRAIAGYYLGFDPPSSMRTALALRQGIWRKGHPHWHICGIPEVLYTDNGSDFTSKHLEQVAVDLKIRLCSGSAGRHRKTQRSGCIRWFLRTPDYSLRYLLMRAADTDGVAVFAWISLGVEPFFSCSRESTICCRSWRIELSSRRR